MSWMRHTPELFPKGVLLLCLSLSRRLTSTVTPSILVPRVLHAFAAFHLTTHGLGIGFFLKSRSLLPESRGFVLGVDSGRGTRHFATRMENSNPNSSSEDFQGIRFFNLVEFCNAPDFNTGEIREISHYKETNLPGEPVNEHLPGSVVTD